MTGRTFAAEALPSVAEALPSVAEALPSVAEALISAACSPSEASTEPLPSTSTTPGAGSTGYVDRLDAGHHEHGERPPLAELLLSQLTPLALARTWLSFAAARNAARIIIQRPGFALQHQLDFFVAGPGKSSSPNARRIRRHVPFFNHSSWRR